MIERRTIYHAIAEPPEGWRKGTHWLHGDGSIVAVYTNAPANVSPYAKGYEHVFIRSVAVRQAREVREWVDEP